MFYTINNQSTALEKSIYKIFYLFLGLVIAEPQQQKTYQMSPKFHKQSTDVSDVYSCHKEKLQLPAHRIHRQ